MKEDANTTCFAFCFCDMTFSLWIRAIDPSCSGEVDGSDGLELLWAEYGEKDSILLQTFKIRFTAR